MRRLASVFLLPISSCLVFFLFSAPVIAQPEEALREAARAGALSEVKAALDAGVDIESGDHYGATALYIAARAGHLDVVELLAERGADVNAAESFYDSCPLDTALDGGHLEIAKVLLSHGAESREGVLARALEEENIDLARTVIASGPINESALERLRARTSEPALEKLLATARTRPDPEPVPLTCEQLDRLDPLAPRPRRAERQRLHGSGAGVGLRELTDPLRRHRDPVGRRRERAGRRRGVSRRLEPRDRRARVEGAARRSAVVLDPEHPARLEGRRAGGQPARPSTATIPEPAKSYGV